VVTMSQSGTLNQSLASVDDFSTEAAVVTPTGSRRPKSVGIDAVIRRITRRR